MTKTFLIIMLLTGIATYALGEPQYEHFDYHPYARYRYYHLHPYTDPHFRYQKHYPYRYHWSYHRWYAPYHEKEPPIYHEHHHQHFYPQSPSPKQKAGLPSDHERSGS